MSYLRNMYYNPVAKTAIGYRRGQALGFRYGSLGAIASGDFAAVMVQQRNEAGRTFGPTAFNQPGRTDTFYPNVSGEYALKLIKYWRREAARVKQKADGGTLQGAQDTIAGVSAIRTQWMRAVAALSGPTASFIVANATVAGKGLILQTSAKSLWELIDAVVLPMRGINETPSAWDLLGEAVSETLGKSGDLMKIAVFGALAYLGLSAYSKLKG